MKKKQTKPKKENKQIIEIHVYIHNNGLNTNIPPLPYNPNPITNPPWIVTC